MSDFWHAYLFAFLFWLCIPLGALSLLLFNHVSGGAWGWIARRQLEAASLTLPVMAIVFIPLWFNLPHVFPWALPPGAPLSHMAGAALATGLPPGNQAAYLAVPFLLGRAVAYFAVWIAIAALLSGASLRQDREERPDPALDAWMTRLSYVGIGLMVLSVSFFAVDWLMSLEPNFSSALFGLRYFTGALLCGGATMTLSTAILHRRIPQFEPLHLQDMGTLTFGLLLLFVYLAYMEYLIVWAEDLPKDTAWFFLRSGNGWQWVMLTIFLGGVALPFLLLLNRQLKRTPRLVGPVMGLLLVGHAIWMFWAVMPESSPTFTVTAWDVGLWLSVGVIWVGSYAMIVSRLPLLPRHHPPLHEVYALE